MIFLLCIYLAESLTMEDNSDWVCDDKSSCVSSSSSDIDLKTEVKCEQCCEDQLHYGALVRVERYAKEEVPVKEERKDVAVTDIEEKVSWVFDEALACENWSDCDPPGENEEKEEAGFEEHASHGTDVHTAGVVKVEVHVKEEREDQSGMMQCLTRPGVCCASACQSGRAEGNIEYKGLEYVVLRRVSETGLGVAEEEHGMAGVSVSEGQQAICEGSSEDVSAKREGRKQVKCKNWPYVLLRRLSGTDLRFAQEEQNLEDMSVCEGQQAMCGGSSEGVREGGKYKRRRQLKCNLQPSVILRRLPETDLGFARGEQSVENVSEKRRVSLDDPSEFVAGMSASSCVPLASCSNCSSPEVAEPGPDVSGDKTAQLSLLETRQCRTLRQQKQQCRKKGPMQRPSSVKHKDAGGVRSSQGNMQTLPEGVRRQRQACPHCEFRCAMRDTLTRHVERCHGNLKRLSPHQSNVSIRKRKKLKGGIEVTPGVLEKYPCPHCQFRSSWETSRQRHVEKVHGCSRRFKCPRCSYRAGRRGHLQRHVKTVHEGLRKHRCPFCLYKASERWILRTHLKTVHEESGKYKCPRCPYRAGRSGHLRRHRAIVHEGLREHRCPHCPYRAGERCTVHTHIEIVHEGVRKHQCPHCPYRAGWKGHLQRHVKNLHEDVVR